MNQKQIGVILIITSIILASVIYSLKVREDKSIETFIGEAGTCYLDDGTCLHDDRNYTPYILGWVFSLVLLIFGLYLTFIDKSQEMLIAHQKEISGALAKARDADAKKDEFNAFLSGFSSDEKKVLSAIKDQDGITQSTLRFKTGMSKTTLSLLLKSLEEREIISRKESGKTKEVYLQKKF